MKYNELSNNARAAVDLFRRYMTSDSFNAENDWYNPSWFDEIDLTVRQNNLRASLLQLTIEIVHEDECETLIAIFQRYFDNPSSLQCLIHYQDEYLSTFVVAHRNDDPDVLQLYNLTTRQFENA